MAKLDNAALNMIRRRAQNNHYPQSRAVSDVRLLLEHLDALEIEAAMRPANVVQPVDTLGAPCRYCGQNMLDPKARSCRVQSVEFPDGTTLPAVPYANELVEIERRDKHRCHDCGVALGGYHHPGCDMECCPKCGGQLISCGCLDDPDADD